MQTSAAKALGDNQLLDQEDKSGSRSPVHVHHEDLDLNAPVQDNCSLQELSVPALPTIITSSNQPLASPPLMRLDSEPGLESGLQSDEEHISDKDSADDDDQHGDDDCYIVENGGPPARARKSIASSKTSPFGTPSLVKLINDHQEQ